MTLLRHVTAGEKIRALLKERKSRKDKPWNITQLAASMKTARESVSRRVNDQISMTEDYAERFAAALGVSPADLLPPEVEVISLASIDRHLLELEEKVDAALTGISDVLDLLRGAPGQSDADAPRGSP